MSNIEILATRPSGHPFPIISWVIRVLEWSSQSHVTIFFPAKGVVRHAHFNSFKEEHISQFLKSNRVIKSKELELTSDEYAGVEAYTRSKLGRQSGYFLSLFGNLIPQLCRVLFNIKLRNPLYKGMTCSEFVRNSLKKVDESVVLRLTDDIPEGTFTTNDALELTAKLTKVRAL